MSASPEDTVQLQENLIRTHLIWLRWSTSWRCCSCHHVDPYQLTLWKVILAFVCQPLKTVRIAQQRSHPYIPERLPLGSFWRPLLLYLTWFLPMLGLGQALLQGELLSGQAAFDRWYWKIQLAAKEGLALINGYNCSNRYRSSCNLRRYSIV